MAKPTATVPLAVVVAALFMTAATAQAPAPAPMPSGGGGNCQAGLTMCAAALNGTKPSKECCDAMKMAVETQLQCLCDIFKNPQFLATFNLTPETALLIPQKCGLKAGPNLCSAAAAPSPKSVVEAPSTPGSQQGNNAAKLAGSSALAGIFLITMSMMFY